MTYKIPVLFDERMCAPPEGSYSPSSEKPRLVVDDWLKRSRAIEVQGFEPATIEMLKLAHDPAHVDAVLSCRSDNGFGNKSRAVADSLSWTTGSMLSAAVCALGNRDVACSPSSGFHHAGYDYSSGFCTFNGLVVTAMQLKRLGLVSRVAIIDCDQHYGDGTADIIDRLGLSWIVHWSAGAHFRRPDQADHFLGALPRAAQNAFHGSSLVLYQAGADQHVNDPLGGMLTTEQMVRRDRCVFWFAREFNVPIVWNLAGGYQRSGKTIDPVLELHRNTLDQAVRIFNNQEPWLQP